MFKILVADDERPILALLEASLKSDTMDITTAADGQEAIRLAFEIRPDLIITDIQMPFKTGFDVCKAVRQDPDLADTPIIILSAMNDDFHKLTGFEEGADDYITKPFLIEELKARVNALLLRYTKYQKKSNQAKESLDTSSIKTVSTRIPELDEALSGGFPVGSNMLVIGAFGSGKSTFGRQFLVDGLTHADRCLFVAVDDNPDQIRGALTSAMPKPVSELEKYDLIRFVDAYSWTTFIQPENEKFAVTGMLELTQLSGLISDASAELGQSIQTKLGGRRVIDSISSLLVNFDLPSVQRFVGQISRTSTSYGGVTSLFLMEDGTVSDIVLNNVKYFMDGILEFKDEDGAKFVRVVSMKWSKFSPKWVKLPEL
ncbi:MAG: response regulator [Candidatus Margulisiibacteriota bacterium]